MEVKADYIYRSGDWSETFPVEVIEELFQEGEEPVIKIGLLKSAGHGWVANVPNPTIFSTQEEAEAEFRRFVLSNEEEPLDD